MRVLCSGRMPGPLSCTSTMALDVSSKTRISISPRSGENFTALSIRFTRACRRIVRSTLTWSVSLPSTRIDCPFSSDRNLDQPPFGRELHSVIDQIYEGLPQNRAVHIDLERIAAFDTN